jgi:ureidoacrylate peracid hydrolase
MATVTYDRAASALHAALDVNIPNYASAIVSTKEIVDSLSYL